VSGPPSLAGVGTSSSGQIIELRKENFNLKLRIYYLEERMQQKFDGPDEDIYRINIELKVELESLKRELQEREQLLIKASKAVESLAQGDAEIKRLKEEAHKEVQQVEESLKCKISHLEEDLKVAKEEVEKAFAMTEQERVLRLAAEQQLSLITNRQSKDLDVMTVLEEKDRCIEQLSLSLKNKEALIQCLEAAESRNRSLEESLSEEKIQDHPGALVLEKEEELEVRTINRSLQKELHEREMELSVEKINALKRDKTIQGLVLAVKVKEKENEKLCSEIEDLNTPLAEATQKIQMRKFKGVEDPQTLLMEKESLLADLRSENLTKDLENHNLQRKVKKTEQELHDLNLEKETLVKELEEAQLQKSRSDKAINDLRNQLEKFHDEMADKEKALELHYSVLLSEGNQKLQSQELVITHLTASIAQKDELLQVGILDILIFFTFEFYFSINNVQEELHNISVLRKQLEDDILANWNLRRVLESQIKANRREVKHIILFPETETTTPESKLAMKELNQEFAFSEKEDVDATTTYSDSRSLLSLSLRITSIDAFDYEATDDIEELRQIIKILKSELAKYRMLMIHFEPAKQLPSGDILSTTQNDGELPTHHHFLPIIDASRPELQTFSDEHLQEEPQIRIKDLTSHDLEQQNEKKIQKLKELLSENEMELEKEQIANIHLLDEVCRLQNKLKGVSLARHDSPIHSPVHEQSYQRQKIQEIHSICATYRQHLSNLIRAFEELLQASEVDYCVAEGFREQLNQSAQLFERLEQQCLYGAWLCLLLIFSYRSQTHIPICFLELLMEHLQEIRMLRHQLEESIRTNDRLRKQLEQQVSDSAQEQGSANVCIRGSEQHNSLTSEIHFLRKQNQALNMMLAKGSQEKQKENEKLRESLSKKHLAAERLHKDYEHLKKEKEKLQKQLGKQEEENGHLTHDIYSVRNELNRLQIELNAKQHQLSENDKLLHSLQLELKVYEKLDEAIRNLGRDGSDECWKDQNHPLDLHELLTEIQNFRMQLERSIKANKTLHEKLEEQLSRGKREGDSLGSTVNIGCLLKQELQHYTGINGMVYGAQSGFLCWFDGLAVDKSDSSSRCNSPANHSSDPCLVPSHCVWADKNGRHILGLIEDYNSLRKQILEGRKRLSELELPLKEAGLQELGVTVPQLAFLSRLSTTICAIQHNLEEAARLLKLLWRVSLPMKVVHNVGYAFQVCVLVFRS
uniref:CDK5 regulatory subunit associated protein 2 n=1 Tax=Podarcis muralis TaxID=64176 RepID=A0A670JLH0_PODMU